MSVLTLSRIVSTWIANRIVEDPKPWLSALSLFKSLRTSLPEIQVYEPKSIYLLQIPQGYTCTRVRKYYVCYDAHTLLVLDTSKMSFRTFTFTSLIENVRVNPVYNSILIILRSDAVRRIDMLNLDTYAIILSPTIYTNPLITIHCGLYRIEDVQGVEWVTHQGNASPPKPINKEELLMVTNNNNKLLVITEGDSKSIRMGDKFYKDVKSLSYNNTTVNFSSNECFHWFTTSNRIWHAHGLGHKLVSTFIVRDAKYHYLVSPLSGEYLRRIDNHIVLHQGDYIAMEETDGLVIHSTITGKDLCKLSNVLISKYPQIKIEIHRHLYIIVETDKVRYYDFNGNLLDNQRFYAKSKITSSGVYDDRGRATYIINPFCNIELSLYSLLVMRLDTMKL